MLEEPSSQTKKKVLNMARMRTSTDIRHTQLAIAHFQIEWQTRARMVALSIMGSYGDTYACAKFFFAGASFSLLLLLEQKEC